MKWLSHFWLCFCYVQVYLWCAASAELGNPYEILGVHRKASTADIRKTYKQLAKEWHPDKTRDPSTDHRFVEIKQAYELLADPERRKRFDDKGITEEDLYREHENQPFRTNPFDDIFSQHGAHFNFQENDITFFHKLSITTRQYDKLIVPKSEKAPHLIFFYNDWCFACMQATPYCRKLVDKLEPLGVNLVTVHSGREPLLARRLNIHTVPCLVLLLDGNSYVYKETITSVQRIIEFLRSKMPYKLVPKITHHEVDDFLDGWEDNRVRGLIFEPRLNMRLRYLVTAYNFRQRVAFGFVDNSPEIRLKYQVPTGMDTVLLFNENVSAPMASLSMKDIPTSTLHHVVSSNQYLALPRLSSQGILEALCPCEWNKPRKRLCVVLVTSATSSHDPHRQSFRSFAQNSPYSTEKVRFAYIYHDKQIDFVNSLIPEGELVEPVLRIVILWRRDTSHVKYEWITAKWESETNLNQTTQNVESTISRLLRSSEALGYEALVKDLFDEHAKGMFGRIASKFGSFVGSMYDDLNKDQVLPAVSILGTFAFILVVGYFLSYLVRIEEENVQQQKANAHGGNNNNEGCYQPELRLHELRAEKYHGLIRLLKPGCRTILLVLDMQSRHQLIPPFHKAMWPYRKNKTLMFSFMYIERGLSWYKELLQLSLPEERELNINPRNCVGTVLALNGHRKYFCMFHAKHTEKSRRMEPKVDKQAAEKDCESGTFIGFETDSSGSEEEVLLQENLLDSLPNWLDRLFEGTTQRYHINYWPDFPISK